MNRHPVEDVGLLKSGVSAQVSYSAAISACDKVGQWEVALHLLSSMALVPGTCGAEKRYLFGCGLDYCEGSRHRPGRLGSLDSHYTH